MKFTLANFNIVKINEIKPHYDDLKNKKRNEFEEIDDKKNKTETVKKWKKFGVTLTVSPKKTQSYIVSSDDHEIGEFKSQRVDIIPFLKDEKFWYLIRDRKTIGVELLYEFNFYYKYNEGAAIIKQKLRDPYELINDQRVFKPLKFSWYGSQDKLEEKFITSKRFNYSKDIEWETD